MEEKIKQLKELFKQRDEIDLQIEKILGNKLKFVKVKKQPNDKKPKTIRRAWTEEEDKKLLELKKEGKSLTEIGRILDRGDASTWARYSKIKDDEDENDDKKINMYECIDCGEKFKATTKHSDTKCPKNYSHTIV